MNKKPILAITMGDPAGVGPEITIKALNELTDLPFDIIVIGDIDILKRGSTFVNLSPRFASVDTLDNLDPNAINVLDLQAISVDSCEIGKVSAACGKASYDYITRAICLALNRQVAGIVTNPINKEALKKAGIEYPGHTEILAAQTNTSDFSMLFYLDGVGVAHATTHCSLRQAIDMISQELVLKHTKLLDTAMRHLDIKSPRIAISGLNPHAGEHGIFGDEEIKHIEPAVKKAQELGINASGPYPPDTVFMRAFKGEFDGVVSMLHDHGFVALKSRDFEHGVNITIGLPIIRTSVGHGTAFDIAGTGKASTESLKSAINLAWLLYKNGALTK